jgi:hypothetical protein
VVTEASGDHVVARELEEHVSGDLGSEPAVESAGNSEEEPDSNKEDVERHHVKFGRGSRQQAGGALTGCRVHRVRLSARA